MACNTTSGAGGFVASGCEEHATIAIPSNAISDVSRRRDLPITGPTSPHHRGNVVLRRPNQRDNPSNYAPSQEQIQQEDRRQVPLAASQRNDRRQKIHQERQA